MIYRLTRNTKTGMLRFEHFVSCFRGDYWEVDTEPCPQDELDAIEKLRKLNIPERWEVIAV